MAEIKIVIGSKDGKCFQKELKDESASVFLGKKIGSTINGEAIGATGYEFQITGGSDKQGFPMRLDNDGTMRKRIMTNSGTGFKKSFSKGIRIVKSVAGNTIFQNTAQVNMKVVKEGTKKLGLALGLEQEEAPKEEAKAEEKPKEEKTEKPKEEKKEEKKEEAKPKEKKEEAKPEEKK